ncbi:hypothetical protein [Falsigemmobacter faecalis]|uniref:Alpha/beta hydrolase n=1 Tax=Falsigemmobacter faecalis TaxID=2488730 RepID=A0A3P3DSP5_9RHOB|nr:hypothetical protein [Falsigemmobacter faecalis]RRH76964.1 hypothetical protein EG244_05005 [Falsigemmobacter faecalis]
MTEIRTADYVLRAVIGRHQGPVLFSFHFYDPRPGLEGPIFAEDYAQARGWNWIGLKPRVNDWYQGAEVPELLDQARQIAGDLPLIVYGPSMGAFAAVNFAARLRADYVLALAPQVTVNPAKALYDDRWAAESAQITFRHEWIEQSPPIRRGLLIYSSHRREAAHAHEILRHHPGLTPMVVPFAGHQPGWVLSEADVLGDVVAAAMQDRIPLPHTRLKLRRNRLRSKTYVQELLFWLQKRGSAEAGLRLILQLSPGLLQHWPIALARHLCLRDLGRLDAAAEVLEPWLAATEHGDLAAWHLAQLSRPPCHEKGPARAGPF